MAQHTPTSHGTGLKESPSRGVDNPARNDGGARRGAIFLPDPVAADCSIWQKEEAPQQPLDSRHRKRRSAHERTSHGSQCRGASCPWQSRPSPCCHVTARYAWPAGLAGDQGRNGGLAVTPIHGSACRASKAKIPKGCAPGRRGPPPYSRHSCRGRTTYLRAVRFTSGRCPGVCERIIQAVWGRPLSSMASKRRRSDWTSTSRAFAETSVDPTFRETI